MAYLNFHPMTFYSSIAKVNYHVLLLSSKFTVDFSCNAHLLSKGNQEEISRVGLQTFV